MEILRRWEDLPIEIKNDSVYPYYAMLKKKKYSIVIKRIFDFILSGSMLIILSPVFLLLAICIKIDSKGPVFFRQERITQYGKVFRIFKFRTMVANAEKIGSKVTIKNDSRITKVGQIIRKCRLDEIPQLLNILVGDMSFVGTRPEVRKYVEQYTPEMYATLLLPAGVTSKASIMFKDEENMLENVENIDEVYVQKILPMKMKYNLETIQTFSIWNDLKVMFQTVKAVF